MISEPNTADQKPRTWKPEMTPEAIISIKALMMKVKKPRVRRLMGRVKIKRIGRKKAFNIPRIAAAKKAEKKPATSIPSIR
jgi:hypothetical protein